MQIDKRLADRTGAVVRAESVAELFANVFDRDSVGIDDDFFSLGGDSLSGAELMTAIEQRFGPVLPLSVLLEAPTPRALAEAILDKSLSRILPYLIGINPNGTPPPLFCVHGNEGESIAPQQLSTVLGRRAFYAFRAIGLEQAEEFLISVEALATAYLAGIAEVRPKGPIIVFGHCAGASIAYEMAQKLRAAGKQPAGLILADPEVSADFAPYLHNSGLALTLLQASWRKRAAQLYKAARSNPNPTGAMRRKIVTSGIQHAVGTYIPQPYSGKTLLLFTSERKAALMQPGRGYPALVKDLEAVELQTHHGGMFKAGLPQVAQAIERFVSNL
jgi:thioesterase domain-containing protein/acyl carrier protein